MDPTNAGAGAHRPQLHKDIQLSSVVAERVASFISDMMLGHFFEELATKRDGRGHTVVPNAHRQDLLSMCLVHRSWTPIVQRILRRRVRIHSPKKLKAFLESPACGPWVTELWYIYDRVYSDYYLGESLSDLGENEKTHWDLLAELLARLPNLRFLAVDVNDAPDSYAEQQEIRKKYKKVEASRPQADNDPAENVCREEAFEYRGVGDVLKAIGRLIDLEGLVMLCDAVDITRSSKRSSRYFPYFAALCQQFPSLSSLKYLRIGGWSGWYDMDEDENPRYRYFRKGENGEEEVIEEREEGDDDDDEDDDRSRVRVNKEPLSECLIDKHPPASLKTLILELPHRRFPTSHIKWLQVPQGNYAPENLFVRFNIDCDFMHSITWSSTLGEMKRDELTLMPALRNVRLEFPEKGSPPGSEGGGFERILRQGIAKLLTQRIPNVDSLQAPPIFLDATIPPLLDDFHIVLDKVRHRSGGVFFQDNSRNEIWRCRDQTIRDILRDVRHQLDGRSVTITSTAGEDDVERYLPNTVNWFKDEGLDLFTATELSVRERIRDFLLHGQVQYPGDFRCLVDSIDSDDDDDEDEDEDINAANAMDVDLEEEDGEDGDNDV